MMRSCSGKRHPLHRERDVAASGRTQGRQRGRLYRALDEHFADRRFHPDPSDGRYCRPTVPRIRDGDLDLDHNLAGDFAFDNADDVCGVAPRGDRRRPWQDLPDQRTLLRGDAELLSANADFRTRTSPLRHDDPRRGVGPEFLFVQYRAEGLLPATGYGPDHRDYPG